MSLGEAFVEVHADLRPFDRDLRRSLKPIVEAFERELNKAVGRSVVANAEENGRQIGDRLSRGMKNSLTHQFKEKNAFIAVAAALGSALDDGISALPTEIKAALVLGILLATPIIAAFLTGAIVAGIGAGVAGLGILLASQFQSVQQRSTEFGRNVRNELVAAAGAFEPALLGALDIIEGRLRGMRQLITDIFDFSADFIEPLTQGALGGLQELLDSLRNSLSDIKPFIDELGVGIEVLGEAIGQAIEILSSTGPDGVKALRDLFAIVAILIVAAASLLYIFTKFYGIIRDLVGIVNKFTGGVSLPLDLLDRVFNGIDNRSNQLRAFFNTTEEGTDSMQGLIVATKGETDALEEYSKAIDAASQSAKDNLSLNLDWEESLDRIAEALDKNGKTLDVHTEKGRNNIREFMNGLRIAEERALLRVQRGEATSEQAAAQYQKEIEQLRVLSREAGIGEQVFNDLFNEIITTSAIRISAQDMGVTDLGGELNSTANAAQRLADLLALIKHLSVTISKGALAGVRGYSEGGIAHFPETVNVAEDGAEVIIPLTKPARAAQLLQESGLASMMGTNGASQVLVFVGNEQLESRMVRVVERNNKAQALALNHGGRTS